MAAPHFFAGRRRMNARRVDLIMNLSFDAKLAQNYKSRSQQIRVMSEAWGSDNLYCPCCGGEKLQRFENNRRVADFFCDECGEEYELKSKGGNIGRKIVDGAYASAIERINCSSNPNLLVLRYCGLLVSELVFVPKFFFVPSVIERRKALSKNARRGGWEGSNILYSKIPPDGRISIIKEGSETDKGFVLGSYRRIKPLETKDIKKRGWLLDVLSCVNGVGEEFALKDIYKFSEVLKAKHAENNNVEAKIRQQLQLLRDKGFIEFLGGGRYRRL